MNRLIIVMLLGLTVQKLIPFLFTFIKAPLIFALTIFN